MMKLAWLLTYVANDAYKPELCKEYPAFYECDKDYEITRIAYVGVEEDE